MKKTTKTLKTLEVLQSAFAYKEFHSKSANKRKTLEVLQKVTLPLKSLSKFDKASVARALALSMFAEVKKNTNSLKP